MLNILQPLTGITGPVVFGIDSLPMSFIILPLPLVDISIGMDKSASSVGPVINPVTLIERVVLPDLLALAIPHAVPELPDVPDSIPHIDRSL